MKYLFFLFTLLLSCTISWGQNISDKNPETIQNAAPPDDGGGGGGHTYKWNRDRDGDGFGDPRFPRNASTKPPGYVANQDDCNDNDPTINPNTLWYRDADNDGYGNPNSTRRQCITPTGYVRNKDDYDDSTSLITDISPKNFYRDADNDSYGDPNVKKYQSHQPNGYVTNNSDYDDNTSLITNIKPKNFYRDADSDSYGNPNVKKYQSYIPNGYVTNNQDCNDNDNTINPNTKWYSDQDNDGYGDPNKIKKSCTKPNGYVNNKDDQCLDEYGIYLGCENKPVEVSNENYIYTLIPQKPTPSISVSSTKDIISNIAYFDGLGRSKQQIAINASSNKKDIITHIDYDNYGRKNKEYLPFERQDDILGNFKSVDITTDINRYYKNKYPDDFSNLSEASTNAYSETIFEASPLNRITKIGAPGQSWKSNVNTNDNTIKFNWSTNKANEVPILEVDFINNDLEKPSLVRNGFYKEKQLHIVITKDENWTSEQQFDKDHTTEEYKDKNGTLILKRTYNNNEPHDTYYVYDRFGNLTYVIPPKVTIEDNVSTIELNTLCYHYKYDGRNRLIEKKIPGKGWEFIVYNTIDQPIMTQDAKQRNKSPKEWSFIKYDAFGRVAYTGMTKNNSIRHAMQESADNTTVYTQHVNQTVDAIIIEGTNIYYTNDAMPRVISEIYTINYYDNYNFDLAGGTNPNTVYNQPITTNVKTLPTGSKIKVLGTNKWITTVNYYDEKSRLIYGYTKNEFLETVNTISHKLDFTGKVKESKTTHKRLSNAVITTRDRFDYDHMGRLLTHKQTINNQSEELITSNAYDELGVLIKKDIGGTTNNLKGLQTINYKHNVRGWLTHINDPNTLGDDLFALNLNHNNPLAGVTSLYNGNISAIFWKTANDNINRKRRYIYEYDALNRITKALHGTGNYDLNNMKYDKNGNILRLARNGWQNSSNYNAMDNLFYTYNEGNKLIKVTDTGNKSYGFKDGTNTNNDYTYDANGNMTKDRNKGIDHIKYNHLNLPTQIIINGKNIYYTYDATGVKLGKGLDGSVTLYDGSYIYKKDKLQFFGHPEGYVKPNITGNFDYVYQYKDHLDNIRLSYTDIDKDGKIIKEEILKENNYYPFGLKHKGYNNAVSPNGNSMANKFKFNGKELEESLGINLYEMDMRQYDPTIARWTSIDPVIHHSLSPFNSFDNNPIFWADPSGANSESSGARTRGRQFDYKGRARYDKNGIYIPVHKRGAMVSSNIINNKRKQDNDNIISASEVATDFKGHSIYPRSISEFKFAILYSIKELTGNKNITVDDIKVAGFFSSTLGKEIEELLTGKLNLTDDKPQISFYVEGLKNSNIDNLFVAELNISTVKFQSHNGIGTTIKKGQELDLTLTAKGVGASYSFKYEETSGLYHYNAMVQANITTSVIRYASDNDTTGKTFSSSSRTRIEGTFKTKHNYLIKK